MLLSDHGFTTLKKEVYLNKWLEENGYLKFMIQNPDTLNDIHPESIAYSLYPGRIYLNLKGREKNGSVEPGLPFENIRQELKYRLLNIIDPENKTNIIKKVYYGEEIYNHDDNMKQIIKTDDPFPEQNKYPDLIAIPINGYDLKGNLWRDNIFEKTVFNGMHTFDDAFILLRNGKLPEERFSISKVASLIYKIMKVDNLDSVADI
jgi:predicted AlkP superfamily phosphohydrolase/phosphomutase